MATNPRKRERRVSPLDDDQFFITPPAITRALLEREIFTPGIAEVACGNGAISKVLEGAGYRVVSTDLRDRGYGTGGWDFLAMKELPAGCESVVTNPPFKLSGEFMAHAIRLGARKVAMFGRISFLEGQARHNSLFGEHLLSRVWVFSSRQTLWRGDDPNPKDKGGAMSFAWFVHERRHINQVGWVP